VVDALLENAEKALGRRPVKIGAEGKEVYVYRGDVANCALQLAGLDIGLFTERKEVNIRHELAHLSDADLIEELNKEARLLLEHQSGGAHNDGNGDPGA